MDVLHWIEFAVLWAAALVGGAAVLPYTLKLLTASAQGKPPRMGTRTLLLLSWAQTAFLAAIAIGLGLPASHAIGLGAPYLEAALGGAAAGPAPAVMLRLAIGLGAVGGLVLLLADLLFLPRLPRELLATARNTTLAENFAASFYGGLNEEFLFRLFVMSAVAWLLSWVWHTSAGLPTTAVYWGANGIAAGLFGLGHLPAAKGLLGRITPLVAIRSLLLNGWVGLTCGWLFWRYGLEAAVVAHFTVDIVYHVGGTLLLRLLDRRRSG